jgi:hydrogenase maturation protease
VLVARQLQKIGVPAVEQSGGAIELMESWSAFSEVIVVDAMVSGTAVGKITVWEAHASSFPENSVSCSSHGLGLREAIEMARALDRLPQSLTIYGIEGCQFVPGAMLSVEVEAAVDEVAHRIAGNWIRAEMLHDRQIAETQRLPGF